MDQHVFSELRRLFCFDINRIEPFVRESGDPVQSFFIETKDSDEYFLKEIQPHSLRECMDRIYEQFSKIRPKDYRLVLPLSYGDGRFLFESEGKKFLLFHREYLEPFDEKAFSHIRLLDILKDFHRLIADFELSGQEFRTYESWLKRGPARLRQEYGENLPLVDLFDDFMTNRFPKLGLAEGNIHWDFHSYNLRLDGAKNLVILDFDFAQPGAYACDLIRATNMYMRLVGEQVLLDAELFQELITSIPEGAVPLEPSDVRLLLCRTPMISPVQWQNPSDRYEDCVSYLRALERFIIE